MANATTVERPPTAAQVATLPLVRRRFRRAREGFAAYWFVLPIIVIFVVLYLIPMAQSVFYSFTDYNGY